MIPATSVGPDSGPGGSDAPSPGPEARLAARLDRLETVPFFRPDAAFGPAVSIEKAAARLGLTDLRLRAQLIQADVLCRRGQTATAGRMIRKVNRWALEHGHRHLLARSHRLLSQFFGYMGDLALSLEHAVHALDLTDETTPPRLQADYLFALARALADERSFESARERYAAVEHIAETLGDVRLRVAVLNDQAYLAYEAGDHQLSLATAERMQTLAAANGVELDALELDTLARVQLEVGRYREAEQTLQPVFENDGLMATGDSLGECLLTMVEIQRRKGDTEAARATLERCRRVCDERDLAGIRVRVEQQLAELYAAEGQFQDAYEQYQLFHRAATALHSVERAARAQTVKAVFETTEARRDSRRFEQMALHDPLTGLYNRRFVEDELPLLLRRASEAGEPLSVGLVDLDHFKRVNDRFSHQVGDEVLVVVASLLEGCVREPGFVARMGGEEFLVVLPGMGDAGAARYFDEVADVVRSHPWAGLGRITVSVGVTTATAEVSKAVILERADHNLHRAKRAGRDVVVSDND
jgi:two-component system, cell cycle response regulator